MGCPHSTSGRFVNKNLFLNSPFLMSSPYTNWATVIPKVWSHIANPSFLMLFLEASMSRIVTDTKNWKELIYLLSLTAKHRTKMEINTQSYSSNFNVMNWFLKQFYQFCLYFSSSKSISILIQWAAALQCMSVKALCQRTELINTELLLNIVCCPAEPSLHESTVMYINWVQKVQIRPHN